ncbi:hypothetical protein LCGC14_2327540 [marine sediment metagenome]|uniref:Nucleotidase n=1 Tax=marine sediment metagenome TaxID=412755 RepID=A0A0F9CGK0_9ZZZZ
MTQPLRIGIDIDGVLASGFATKAAEILSKPEGWLPDQWNFGMKWDDLGKLLDQIFATENLWLNSPCWEENCKALVSFLVHHDDVELFYITARRACAGNMSLQRQTRHWLINRSLYWDNCTLIVAGEKTSKKGLIEQLGIRMFLDDHLKQVLEIRAASACEVFLLDQPYNRPRPSSIPVVRNVAEYLEEVEKWLRLTKQSPQS